MTDESSSEIVLLLEQGVYPADAIELLAHIGTVVVGNTINDPTVGVDKCARAIAVLIGLGHRIDVPFLARFPRLRWLVTPTTGLSHIDQSAAHERGIEIISLQNRTSLLQDVAATAELGWALLLALTRRLPEAEASVAAGRWDRARLMGKELRGRTLGVIGYGRLGKITAQYGHAFGMAVLAHDIDSSAFVDAPTWVSQDSSTEVLARSDVLALHLPLDSSTEGWLSADRIAALRPGALVINTARGELVDDQALATALRSGHVAGVGADVLYGDASWSNHSDIHDPLLHAARDGCNVIITPHIGGYAQPAIGQARRIVVEDLLSSWQQHRHDSSALR